MGTEDRAAGAAWKLLLVCWLLLGGVASGTPGLAPWTSQPPTPGDEAQDLTAARALFDRNLAAIFNEDREAYLACYLDSERLVRVGPEGQALGYEPFAAGLDDVWPDRLAARDIDLTWLGPGLVFGTYRYHAVFSGVASHGLSERLFVETPDGWRIAVTTAHGAPEGTAAPPLALQGATVYDGLGGTPLEDAVIVVADGRIQAVGARGEVSVPAHAELVDLTGSFVTPGLVDTHVHYSQTGWADGRPDAFDVRDAYPYPETIAELERHPERFHRAFLRSGVTAVMDVGGYPWTRQLQAATEQDSEAPHVVAAGPLLATWVPEVLALPDQQQFVLMTDEATVRAAVASHAAQGSAVIKVWLVLADRSLEELTPLVHVAGDAAQAAGLPLVVHATQLEAARVAVEAGASLLVHSVDDAPVDEAFVALCAERGVAYCPTLTVVTGYRRFAEGGLAPELEAQLDKVSPWVADRVRATPPGRELPQDLVARRAEADRRRWTHMAGNLARLHAAGVPIVLGTDAGNPLTLHGPSVGPELQAMQEAGLSPSAVLRAATADAADALGRPDLGRVVVGAVADLLVLEADPGEEVVRLSQPTSVMRAGVLHRSTDL